ncbi:MAG: GTP-binding protein [Candidatus Helarchaeota archaeon]|nr:GTP-binding protein [Candidatus Helarchaeota archaeon]
MSEIAEKIVKGIVFSIFRESGIEPSAWWPEIDQNLRSTVAVKSISLLTGEEGRVPSRIATLPFPTFGLNSVSLFFEISEPIPEKIQSERTKRDCTISLLFNDKYTSFIYKNMEKLESKLKKVARDIVEANSKGFSPNPLYFEKVYEEFEKIASEIRDTELEKMAKIDTFKAKDKQIKHEFKIVLVGGVAVGKTTTLLRYVRGAFRETYKPSVGIEVKTKDILIDDNPIRILIYDFAGQENFENLYPTFFAGADALIILYDITDSESFSKDAPKFYKIFLKYATKKLKAGILIGNKIDLIDQREVKPEWGYELAKKMEFGYTEISAKTGENVDDTFSLLAKKIYEKAQTKI